MDYGDVFLLAVMGIGGLGILVAVIYSIWAECSPSKTRKEIHKVTQEICDEVDGLFPGQRTVSQQELENDVREDFGV